MEEFLRYDLEKLADRQLEILLLQEVLIYVFVLSPC